MKSPRHGNIDDRPKQQKEQDGPEVFHAGLPFRISSPHSGQAS